MNRKHIDPTQKPEAREQEAVVDAAYAEYNRVAAAVTVAWKAAGRPRDGGFFDPKSKAYQDYQNSLEDKEEAYRKWQREASIHGHMLIPQAEG
jgi:hypothetical protein